jgi:hypothetical protein
MVGVTGSAPEAGLDPTTNGAAAGLKIKVSPSKGFIQTMEGALRKNMKVQIGWHLSFQK